MTHFPFVVTVTFEVDGILGRERYGIAASAPEVALAMAGVFLGIEIGMRYAHDREELGSFRIRLLEASELPMEPAP